MKHIAFCSIFLALLAMLSFWLHQRQSESLSAAANWEIDRLMSAKEDSLERVHSDAALDKGELRPNTLAANRNNRDEMVQAKLDNFIKKTAHISAESVEREREKIAGGLKEAQARNNELPSITRVVDENGGNWEQVKFSDGMVRFIPIADEEKNL